MFKLYAISLVLYLIFMGIAIGTTEKSPDVSLVLVAFLPIINSVAVTIIIGMFIGVFFKSKNKNP